MNNKPAQTFVMMGIIVAVLLFMHLMPQLSLADTELRSVDILSDVVVPVIDIYGVEDEDDEKPLSGIAALKAEPQPEAEAEPVGKRPLPKGLTPIQDFSGGSGGGMEAFYTMLRDVDLLDRPVRVAYFGDSFVEGDILTSELREQLQQRFGGGGAGWVDCGPTTNSNRPTVKVHTNGFTSHSVMEKKTFSPSVQGISQRYFTVDGSASLTLGGTKWKKHLSAWDRAMLYFKTNGGMTIRGEADGDSSQTFRPEAGGTVQKVNLEGNMGKVKWNVSGASSRDVFYGAAIETQRGIVVDNFSMRGCSGKTLTDIPETTLQSFAQVRPYDLIIIHYGLNVAGPKTTETFGRHYKGQMTKVIQMFRRCFPQASILVVGVPDRDQRTASGIKTIKGVDIIMRNQKELAKEQHVAFYSMYDAMGGKNGMSSFVKKGWASKDYTHISLKGGDHLGRKLFDALMYGYDN